MEVVARVKQMRQFVSQYVISWHKRRYFVEVGVEAARNSHKKRHLTKHDGEKHDSWNHMLMQKEPKGIQDDRVIKVGDELSA